ncbi:MAG TPA: hypothetical protein VEK08_19385 [Planctomycetota bacterium]|nr:hypothetical protein [Planctomycetota bacterium]
MALTFFMLAGEASGDTHAAKLITALKAIDPAARCLGMGGPKMAAAGMEVLKDLDGMQVVGFWEVAKKYGFFKKVFYELLDRVKQTKPDALICIDYPGFNLRFAKEVKKLGIPVLYYIVPQVWAWKAMRAKSMAEFVDRAYCVFDFEPPWFLKYGLKAEFVGHPLVDHDSGLRIADCGLELPPGPKTVAFLPGSREGELRAHTEPMCQAFSHLKRATALRGLFSIQAGITKGYANFVKHYLDLGEHISEYYKRVGGTPRADMRPLTEAQVIVSNESEFRAAVKHHSFTLPAVSDFSVVKSGTSTLEAGLAGNPMCVVYKASSISYAIAHLLVNIPVFSLVNIVLGRYAVPELLQSDVNPQRIAQEIERGLNDEKYREQQKAALAELPKKLGGPGASSRAAKGMIDFLRGR